MLIRKLKINYFGRFSNKEIELKPGINLIYGDNEAGKSTIHSFVKGMFFGIERLRGRGAASKDDLYTRYLPWEYPGAYGGSMDIEIGDKQYRLHRSFHANDKSFTVMDLSTGREVQLKEGMICELIPGLSESTFKNTISIEQLKARTDSELSTQVRNYIANLSVAKSKEVNVGRALSFLTEQRKKLEPTQNPAVLKSLETAIEEGIAREAKMDELTGQLQELLEQEKQIQAQKEELTPGPDNEAAHRMEQLPAILEKYHTYQELNHQVLLLDQQIGEQQSKITEGERQLQSPDRLKEDKKLAEALRADLYEMEKQELKLNQKQEAASKLSSKALMYSIPPAVVIGIIIVFLTGLQLTGLLLAAASLLVGISGYYLLNQKNKKVLQSLKNARHQLGVKRTNAQNAIMDIFTKHQVNTLEALANKQEELLRGSYTIEHAKEQLKDMELRRSDIIDNKDSIYDVIMKYLQYFIKVEELTEDTMQRITEELRLRKQETSGRQKSWYERLESCRLGIEKLRWEISTLEGNEEELISNQKKYEKLRQQQTESAAELEAIKLALASIQELSAQIHDSFGQELNLAVSEVISEVTNNKYSDLKVDEKLDIKVGFQGDYVLLERLSAGTIDQVYFALRLAVADLLLGKDEVPLLFDDSFALYDDTRVEAALTEVAKRKQIILFTCHRREQKYLEERGIPYHLVKLCID
jgi:uncharacterized protein YhaN